MRISQRLAINLIFFLALFALAFPFAASALDVYKWTDKNGVVHYSETRPGDVAADMASVESFEIDNAPIPEEASANDYQDMLDVAEQLEQSRLARERARAQELRDARQLQPIAVTPRYADDDVNYPHIYSRASGYYRPYYPHYPHTYIPRHYDDRSGWPLNRGAFVPEVRQRADSYNPAARARAEGGEAIRTH